jgi:hypothetical protein
MFALIICYVHIRRKGKAVVLDSPIHIKKEHLSDIASQYVFVSFLALLAFFYISITEIMMMLLTILLRNLST